MSASRFPPSALPACESFSICFNADDCWDNSEVTARCWISVLVIFLIGCILSFFAEVIPRNRSFSLHYQFRKFRRRKQKERLHRSLQLGIVPEPDPEEELRQAFTTTIRTEENFILNNNDPNLNLPNAYCAEYIPNERIGSFYPISGFFITKKKKFNKKFTSFFYSDQSSLIDTSVMYGSLGVALICSAAASWMKLKTEYEVQCNFENPNEYKEWIINVGNVFASITRDFVFFPIFLIIGYLGFVVLRWRDWLVNCHVAQGRIHDIGMLCGASAIGPKITLPVRQRLYKIYRYLNVVHALLLKSVSPNLGPMSIDFDFVYKLGLLTKEEATILLPMDNKIRDTCHTWLTAEIAAYLRMEEVDSQYAHVEITAAIRELRAACGKHHDLVVRDNPNLYLKVLVLVTNLWILLTIFGYPFRLMVQTPWTFNALRCIQPMVAVGVFVILTTIRTAFSLLLRLRNPFSYTVDRIDTEALLASTDRCIFATLRAQFDVRFENDDAPSGLHDSSNLLDAESAPDGSSGLFSSSSGTNFNTVLNSDEFIIDSNKGDLNKASDSDEMRRDSKKNHVKSENDSNEDKFDIESARLDMKLQSRRAFLIGGASSRRSIHNESGPSVTPYNGQQLVGVTEERTNGPLRRGQSMRADQNKGRFYMKEHPLIETITNSQVLREF